MSIRGEMFMSSALSAVEKLLRASTHIKLIFLLISFQNSFVVLHSQAFEGGEKNFQLIPLRNNSVDHDILGNGYDQTGLSRD